MLRSLFSGVSGMRSQQTKMDTIGNNVANVNTTAFKGARVTFKDALSQTQQGASAPTANMGGVNPKMVGLGVSVAAIDTNMGQGYLQPTGGKTDLAIEGNGMFIVSKMNSTYPTDTIQEPKMEEVYFTRDGSFKLDKNGNLLTAEGYSVMGWRNTRILTIPDQVTDEDKFSKWQFQQDTGDPKNGSVTVDKDKLQNIVIPLSAKLGDGTDSVEVKITDFTIEQDGTIKAMYGEETVELGKVGLAAFQNSAGLEKKGGNLYVQSPNSGEPEYDVATSPGYGKTVQGHLEMSNVDLANEFTEMIITSRAFQANSRTITTSDEMLQELLNLKR